MLTHLLALSGAKSAKHQIQDSSSKRTPLIIHLPKVNRILNVYTSRLVEELHGALREVTPNGLIISTSPAFESNIFASESYSSESDIFKLINALSDTKILQTTGFDPQTQLIRLVPSNSRTQRLLFDKHRKIDSSNERENIRMLQNSVRKLPIELHNSSIIQPYADWSFLNDTPAKEKLVKHLFDQDELDGIFHGLRHEPIVGHAEQGGTSNGQVTDAKIKEAILNFGCRVKALEEWSDSVEDESKWSTFPPQTQTIIREIQRDDSFEWERQFLDLLINPNDVEEGWSEIALEPDIKEAIQRLVSQPANTGVYSYGILKRGRIGGALLYGPPGTGKTYLARVLARESKAITICASAANILMKYVGEAEKAIQALFSLGRMLSPCTIFFDEADALIRARQSDDKSWERTQVNQLLHEMDGFNKATSTPFIVLATNNPNDLDPAILRRVPSRIHIGLPSLEARHRIFQICLADELLHPDVDLSYLAERSEGYSGSDIHTVCVQAALICDTFGDDARRLLMDIHFATALQRSAPTVSQGSLAKIKVFAREYDPAALKSIESIRNAGHLPGRTSSFRPEERKSTRGGDYLSQQHTTIAANGPNGEVEELDNHANGTKLEELEGPYQYIPLQPNSKQIRVLCVSPGESRPDRLLQCTLSTVDLNDWTALYREISSRANDCDMPETPKFRLALWYYVTSFRQGIRSYNHSGADCYAENRFENFWTKFGMKNDFCYSGRQENAHRFNWGDYIALSYVWGDARDKQDILVNGHRFSVNRSLYEALNHLRDAFEREKSKLHVWADAICINQEDQEERAKEVKKMGFIYSQCSSVRAWLGGSTPEIANEVPSIRHVLESISDVGMRELISKSVQDPIKNSGARHSLEVALPSLLSSPFWERLWTIQEVALAPAILFHYSQEAFTGEEILKLCWVFLGFLEGPGDVAYKRVMIGMSKAKRRVEYFCPLDGSDLAERPELDTHALVRLAVSSKSMDPRDKVFGLLALLPGSLAARINPNYDPSFSVQDTFAIFSKLWYESAGSLDSLARVFTRPSFLPDLPSWAWDLSTQTEQTDTSLLSPTTFSRLNVHGANLGMPMRELMFSGNNRLLFCEGCMVDEVGSLGVVQMFSQTLHFDVPAKGEMAKCGNAILAPYRDWKLALARVLIQDSSFEFSESPCVLDIPWPDQELLDSIPRDARKSTRYTSFDNEEPRQRLHANVPVENSFRRFFQGNEDFDVGGKRLRDYFPSSTDPWCLDPDEYNGLQWKLSSGTDRTRLCTTKSGLLASVPQFSRLGDKIIVLTSCDMPMVLRPNGEHYEVVSSCFVEGLMMGEVAEGMKEGRWQMERISIC